MGKEDNARECDVGKDQSCDLEAHAGCMCRNSLLYKGSEDDNELGLEVTGWA